LRFKPITTADEVGATRFHWARWVRANVAAALSRPAREGLPNHRSSNLIDVFTLQQERDAALARYKSACEEFAEAQEQWDPYLAPASETEVDPVGAETAFDRLRAANQAKQDALDSLWLAWRNRPEGDQ
jgi:hypothetical protein